MPAHFCPTYLHIIRGSKASPIDSLFPCSISSPEVISFSTYAALVPTVNLCFSSNLFALFTEANRPTESHQSLSFSWESRSASLRLEVLILCCCNLALDSNREINRCSDSWLVDWIAFGSSLAFDWMDVILDLLTSRCGVSWTRCTARWVRLFCSFQKSHYKESIYILL